MFIVGCSTPTYAPGNHVMTGLTPTSIDLTAGATGPLPGVTIQVSNPPGTRLPEVYFHAYSAEYVDLAGRPIPGVFLPKKDITPSVYLPPADTSALKSASVPVPVVNDALVAYFQAHSDVTSVTSHLTLYGEDGDYNMISLRIDVPIRYQVSESPRP